MPQVLDILQPSFGVECFMVHSDFPIERATFFVDILCTIFTDLAIHYAEMKGLVALVTVYRMWIDFVALSG